MQFKIWMPLSSKSVILDQLSSPAKVLGDNAISQNCVVWILPMALYDDLGCVVIVSGVDAYVQTFQDVKLHVEYFCISIICLPLKKF